MYWTTIGMCRKKFSLFDYVDCKIIACEVKRKKYFGPYQIGLENLSSLELRFLHYI